MFRIIIIDDEPIGVNTLKILIERLDLKALKLLLVTPKKA